MLSRRPVKWETFAIPVIIVIFAFALIGGAHATLDTSKILQFYNFEGTLTDQGQASLTLTNHSATYQNGKLGSYSIGTNTASYLNATGTSKISLGASWTICEWIYSTQNTTVEILNGEWGSSPPQIYHIGNYINGAGTDLSGYGIGFRNSGGTFYFPVTAQNVYVPNTWTYVCFSNNATAGTAQAYVNGVASGAVVSTGTINPSTTSYYVGGDASGSAVFQGRQDALMVYNDSLTASDISTLYSANGDPFPAATSYFSLTDKDTHTGASILTFNATVNGTLYTTTNGTVVTTINTTAWTPLVNVTIDAYHYLQNVTLNYNVSTALQTNQQAWANITAKDLYDSSSLNGFTIEYAGTNYTASGTNAYVPATTALYNGTLYVTNYFPRTFTNADWNQVWNLTAYQAQVTFAGSEVVTGNPLTGFTVNSSSNGGSFTNSTSPNIEFLKAGTYNVTWTKTGWTTNTSTFTITALENDTQTFTNMYQYVVNVTALNTTGGSLSSFTATLTSANSTYSSSVTTSGSQAEVYWYNDTNLVVSVSKGGYFTNSTTISTSTYTNTPTIVNTSVTLTGDYGTNVTFYAAELFTGANITDFTVSTLGYSATGVNPSLSIPIGVYNFTFNKTGWFNATILNFDVNSSGGNNTFTVADAYTASVSGGLGATVNNQNYSNDGNWSSYSTCSPGSFSSVCSVTYSKTYDLLTTVSNASLTVGVYSNGLEGTTGSVYYYNYTSNAYQLIDTISPIFGYTNYTYTLPPDAFTPPINQVKIQVVGSLNAFGGYTYLVDSAVNVSAQNVLYTTQFTGVYPFLLNVTWNNSLGGGFTDNFSVNVSDLNGYNSTVTTTNGTALIPWINDSNITITGYDNPQLATTDEIINTTTLSGQSVVNVTLGSPQTNSISIRFYDEITGALLNGTTVNAGFSSVVQATNVTTTNGTMFVSLLMPSDYVITYSAPAYVTRYYYYALTNQSTTNLTLFLRPQVNSTTVQITVTDQTLNKVVGAIVYMEVKNSTGTGDYLVEECKTDVNGQCLVSADVSTTTYRAPTTYRFLVFVNGAQAVDSGYTQLAASTLSLTSSLNSNPLQPYYNLPYVQFSPITYSNSSGSASATFVDTSGSAREFCLIANQRTGGESTTVAQNCTTAVATGLTVSANTSVGDETTFYSTVLIPESSNLPYLLTQTDVPSTAATNTQNAYFLIFLFLGVGSAIFFGMRVNVRAALVAVLGFEILLWETSNGFLVKGMLIALGMLCLIALIVVGRDE